MVANLFYVDTAKRTLVMVRCIFYHILMAIDNHIFDEAKEKLNAHVL